MATAFKGLIILVLLCKAKFEFWFYFSVLA